MVRKVTVEQIKDALKGQCDTRDLARTAEKLARDKDARFFASRIGTDSQCGEGRSRKCRSVQPF